MGVTDDPRDKKILEGNHIIALFDGMKHFPDQGNQYAYPEDLLYEKDGTLMGSYRWFRDFELSYNSSWDALMPVCKKWNELKNDFPGWIHRTEKLDAAVISFNINWVWPVLRDNIEWYNQKLITHGNNISRSGN